MGCARIGACMCQVGLGRSEYGLCELWEGVSSKKYVPCCVGCSRVDLGHELCALFERWYTIFQTATYSYLESMSKGISYMK